jgi:hypothetical protein
VTHNPSVGDNVNPFVMLSLKLNDLAVPLLPTTILLDRSYHSHFVHVETESQKSVQGEVLALVAIFHMYKPMMASEKAQIRITFHGLKRIGLQKIYSS